MAVDASVVNAPSERGAVEDVDPITLEVISHKFGQLTSELAITLQRTSGSVVVTEGMDFAVSLADADGYVFAVGDTTTMHSVALQHAIQWTLKHRSENPGIEEGDMFLLSDPWVGVVHQPDMALLAPIFIDGRILGWAGMAMHMMDTGGALPGGLNSAAVDVFSEAAPIPPIKFVRGGVIQRDIEESILRRSRLPQLLALDLRAMLASNQVAVTRLHELAATYSPEVLKAVIKRQLDDGEAGFRSRLRDLPDGQWSDVQPCEVARDGDRRIYAVRGTMTKTDDTLLFDLRASDDEAGFLNSTWPATQGGLMAAVLPLLCPDLTWAPGGILRAMKFEYRPGSLVAAEFPASVSAGPIAGGLIVTSLATVLISKMLSSASQDQKRNLLAVTTACIPANFFRGQSAAGYPVFALNTDVIPGGSGARCWRDGDDYAGISLGPASRIPNVEHSEHNYPLLWLFRRELPDSGGAGQFRGGVAGESGVIPYGVTEEGLEMMCAAYGVAIPSSRGLNGGLPAKALGFRVFKDANVLEEFKAGRMPTTSDEFGPTVYWPHPKQSTVVFGVNDVFLSSGAGGGGYGDPIDRDPERVAADVTEGYVTREFAGKIYGVVLFGSEVDLDATSARRAAIRGERLGSSSVVSPTHHGAGDGDRAMLSENLQIAEGGQTICANCATEMTGLDGAFKLGAVQANADLLSLGLVWIDPSHFVDDEIVLRQFSCPTCGTLLESDLVVADEPVVNDRMLGRAVSA